MRWLRGLEHSLLIVGVLALGFYTIAHIDRGVSSKAALETFKGEEASSEEARSSDQSGSAGMVATAPDFGLWSRKRIKDYEDSLALHFAPAIGILRIPRIQLEVPLL